MTAYQLMIRKQKYVPINLRCHSGFIIDSTLKQDHLATLREIDLLTTQYSEIDFRKSLLNEGLISSDDLCSQISIRFSKSGKLITLNDSIIFSDGKSYLDIDRLKDILKLLSDDDSFIRELLSRYLPKDDGIYNTREYLNLDTLKIIEGVLNNNINLYRLKSFLLPYINIISDKSLVNSLYYCDKKDMIKALIEVFYYNEVYRRQFIRGTFSYSYNDYMDYYAFDRDKLQYKRFHDLAKFVYEFDTRRKQIEEEKEYQEEFLEPGELTFDEEYIAKPVEIKKTKKRVRKPLEGQTSFFD